MNHLTEEQLVLHHYHDDDGSAARHLATCGDCTAEYEKLRRVLSLVDTLDVPQRDASYGEQVWSRLRWKLGARKRRTWRTALAAAAVLAIAFVSGAIWHSRFSVAPAPSPALTAGGGGAAQKGATVDPQKVLVVVVGDHLENSERVLAEVANATPNESLDVNTRAAELVASNRIYRQAAASHGDARIASVLADLEPILVELSHADKLTPEELKSLQKRIERKGLLFKVRLLSASDKGIDTL